MGAAKRTRTAQGVWLFALVESVGCSDGSNAVAEAPHDAAAHQVIAQDAAAPDAEPSTPDSALAIGPEAGSAFACETQLAETSFALDPSDCASRPAQPCAALDDARYRMLVRPEDFISYELFKECDKGGFYPVGITFNAQGCAERFHTIPFPQSDPLLQCYLRALQTRRYPCEIHCSNYFKLD